MVFAIMFIMVVGITRMIEQTMFEPPESVFWIGRTLGTVPVITIGLGGIWVLFPVTFAPIQRKSEFGGSRANAQA